MKYYAVIDTNVLVSSLLKWTSVPGSVSRHVLAGNIVPLLNDEILREYHDVLHRPKFHFPKEAVDTFLQEMARLGIYVEAGDSGCILPDPKDAVFYEVVMEHRKQYESYLVTGNIKHFPVQKFVVTPREMLDIIECN